MEPTPHRPSTADRVILAAFLACIALPAVITFASQSSKPNSAMGEKPAEPPELTATWKSIVHYPRTYRDYFDDNFGLRGPLIAAFARVKRDLFDASPSARVVVGQDGWLFYADEHEDECCRNARPHESEALARRARMLEARRAWLAERGIGYLVVAAPDKHSIYGEFQPPSVRQVRRRSRLDEFVDHLREHTGVAVLDLRPALVAAKARHVVYRKLDTHWNQLGAFVAYGRVVDALRAWRPQLRAASLDEFDLRHETRSGDLSKMLGLAEAYEEETPVLVAKKPASARFTVGATGAVNDTGAREVDVLVSESPAAPGLKVVMFRDSFASAVLPFLAEHISRGTYVQAMGLEKFDERVVERERPDVVIQEFVERALMLDAPSPESEAKGH